MKTAQQIAKELAPVLAANNAAIGETNRRIVKVGDGQGNPRPSAPLVPREVFYRSSLDQNDRGVAILAAKCPISIDQIDGYYDTEVWVANVPGSSYLQIVDIADTGGESTDDGATPQDGARRDAAMPTQDRLVIFRITPSLDGGMSVYIDVGPYPVAIETPTGYGFVTSQDIDISDSTNAITFVPTATALASGEHRILGIAYDPTNERFIAIPGTAATATGSLPSNGSRSEFVEADYTAIDFTGYYPCGYVYDYYGVTDYTEDDCRLPFDPRLFADRIGGAGAITLQYIAPSTYTTLQHLQNVMHSTGWVAGGNVTDNGDGTVAVAAGQGLIRATDSAVATLYFFDWPADASISLTDTDDNWVYIDYNAGTPIAVASTTNPTGDRTKIILAYIYRSGTELHINQTWRWTVGDHANLMMRAMAETMPFARVSGGMISGSNRDILITSGTWWNGLTRFTTSAFDSSGADTFNAYYRDGVGGWTEVAAQSEVNNTQYDDGSGTLATLTANRYGVFWVYLATDDDVHVVFGQGDYTLTLAQEAQPPASIPPELVVDSRFVGKIIIQKSAAAFTSVESPFTVPFVVAGGGGTGDVTGPGSSVDNDIALFDGTSGKTIKDSGTTIGQAQRLVMAYTWFMA